jgi:hypothetical protein
MRNERLDRGDRPFCRYYFIQGKCEFDSNCKYQSILSRYSHRNMKDINELFKFFRDNESHMNDLYRAGKLKRLLYHYHDYLTNKVKDERSYLSRWNLHLMKNDPQYVPLKDILSVNPPKRQENLGEDSKLQSTCLLRRTSSISRSYS